MEDNDNKFKQFHKIFLNEIYPQYSHLEKYRMVLQKKQGSKAVKKYALIVLFIFAIIALLEIIRGAIITGIFILVVVSVLMLFVAAITEVSLNKEYKKYLKKELMPALLKAFGNIKWKENTNHAASKDNSTQLISNLFDGDEVLNSEMLVYGDADDEFIGEYKGIKFKISETHLTGFTTDNKGNRNYFQNSDGLVIFSFDFNKKILAPVVILSKKEVATGKIGYLIVVLIFLIPLLAALPIIFIHLHNPEFLFSVIVPLLIFYPIIIVFFYKVNKMVTKDKIPKEEVILEDPKFMKRFDVISSDQVEARYLCTPAFIDKLCNLKTAFGTNKLKCSFYNYENKAKLMIAIEINKDIFELGDISKPIYEGATIYQFFRELNSIYEIIDVLKLNEKITLQ